MNIENIYENSKKNSIGKENKENIYSCIGFSYCNYKWSKSNSMSRS